MAEYNTEKGYAVGIKDNLKDRWISKILEILKFVISVCEDNDLRYYGAAGTVIGTVRHHGFIPWDDDIDIMMPHKDYYKFIEIVSSMKDIPYTIVTPENNDSYYLRFAKVFDSNSTLLEREDERCLIGPFVDIFPKEGCPDDDSITNMLYDRYHNYQSYWSECVIYWNKARFASCFLKLKWKHLLKHIVCHLFKKPIRRYCYKEMLKIETKYDYDSSKKVITWCGLNKCRKEIHERSWMGKGVKMQFEDIKLNIPSQYDEYLKCMYGDYMKLPPKEDQVSHHYVAYLNMDQRETLEEVLNKIKDNA